MTEYLKKMQWQPSVIYYVKAFSRNEKYPPRVWENKGQYGPFFTTDVKVAKYNTIDKKYTEIGDYQFRIAQSILDEVKNYVEKDMPFYLVKGTDDKYKLYSNPNEITEVQQDTYEEKEVKPIKQKPEHKFQTISKFDYNRKIIEWLKDIDRKIELCSTQELEKKFNDIAYILEFISNIDNTLNMILNTILEWKKDK